MTGRIDRYVMRTLLGSTAATLLFLVLLFVVVDLLLNVPDAYGKAREKGLSMAEFVVSWLRFHLLFQPYLFVTVAPFATVIASMFAISRLMNANEIVPVLFTGRSMYRLLRPFLGLGLATGLLMACCWEFVIPRVSKGLNELRQVLDPELATTELRYLFVRAPHDPKQLVVAERYLPDEQRMVGVTLLIEGSQRGDEVLVEAEAADWMPEEQDWDLTAGAERRGDVFPVARQRLGVRGLDPDVLWRTGKLAKQTVELSYSDLIELQTMRPNRADYRLAFHQHLTFPLANVVLLLLALPFAMSFERGSRMGRVFLAIAVCAAYLVVDLSCQNLGRREWLHPVVAAWVPTIFFGSLGAVLFAGIRT
jgi:lipopolysaccharide export system permease protein